MFEESEILSLILGVLSLSVIVATVGFGKERPQRLFSLGLTALLGSYLCTNIEALVAPAAFDVAEHLLFAVAAGFFLAAARAVGRSSETASDD